MKRLATLFLLFVLVFNFFGYRMIISHLQQVTEVTLERQVDKNEYQEAELISIKTTLHLPYYSGSLDFERAYGSITLNGQEYEYVKRRVYNDTLELLCLPNHDKTKLKTTGNELAAASADGEAGVPNKKNQSVKISLPDFFEQFTTNPSIHKLKEQRSYFSFNTISFYPGYSPCPEQPPQI